MELSALACEYCLALFLNLTRSVLCCPYALPLSCCTFALCLASLSFGGERWSARLSLRVAPPFLMGEVLGGRLILRALGLKALRP